MGFKDWVKQKSGYAGAKIKSGIARTSSLASDAISSGYHKTRRNATYLAQDIKRSIRDKMEESAEQRRAENDAYKSARASAKIRMAAIRGRQSVMRPASYWGRQPVPRPASYGGFGGMNLFGSAPPERNGRNTGGNGYFDASAYFGNMGRPSGKRKERNDDFGFW